MSESGSIQIVGRVHHVEMDGRRRVSNEGHVITELHGEAGSRHDACVGQEADHDHAPDRIVRTPVALHNRRER